MPSENPDVWLELVRNAPKIVEALGAVIIGMSSLVGGLAGLISAWYAAKAKVAAELSVKETRKGNAISQESVDVTREGNAKIDAVHEAISQPPPPGPTVIVNNPPAPTPAVGP